MHKYDEYSYTFFEKLPVNLYERYLRKYYKETMLKAGRDVKLNLKNPKLFSEKIQWLKLYDNVPIKSKFTDKLIAKDIVKDIIPEINISKVYSTGKCFDDLDFDVCPEKFVVKTNHASAQVIKVEDKNEFLNSETPLGLVNTKMIVDFWLSRHFAFYAGFEMQYKNIDRKVFTEEYLDDITEYKFICCNGMPEVVICIQGTISGMYNTDWGNLFPEYFKEYPNHTEKPQDLDIMLNYAKKLSQGFKLVRVDLIKSHGKIYFGEMTFTPSSGIIEDEKFDTYMGKKLKI